MKNGFIFGCGPSTNHVLTIIALSTVYQAIKSLNMLCNFFEIFNAINKQSDIGYKIYPYVLQLFLLWSGNLYL